MNCTENDILAIKPTRKDFLFDKVDMARFAAAVNKMKDKGEYQIFVDWHFLEALGIHGYTHFLPWHRAFLRLFEIRLQIADCELHNDGNIGLPIWTWTFHNSYDPNDLRGTLWSPTKGVGGNGNSEVTNPREEGPDGVLGTADDIIWPPGGDVEDGPFADWTVKEIKHKPNAYDGDNIPQYQTPTNTVNLTRALGGKISKPKELERILSIKFYDLFPFDRSLPSVARKNSFRDSLERGFFGGPFRRRAMHNGVHFVVGGMMNSTETSPNDPVFWMHHAFVDYIWSEWQTKHPRIEDNYPLDLVIDNANADAVAHNLAGNIFVSPFPPTHSKYRFENIPKLGEAMVPWDADGKEWKDEAGNILFTTDTIKIEDVIYWEEMGGGLGGYIQDGINTKGINFNP